MWGHSQIKAATRYTFGFVIGHWPLQSNPFQVYAVGPAFLWLLEAPLELTFWNCMGYGVMMIIAAF